MVSNGEYLGFYTSFIGVEREEMKRPGRGGGCKESRIVSSEGGKGGRWGGERVGRDKVEVGVRVLGGERMDLYGGMRNNGHGGQAVEGRRGREPAHSTNGLGLFMDVVAEAPVIG
jgi:hypothetical protein